MIGDHEQTPVERAAIALARMVIMAESRKHGIPTQLDPEPERERFYVHPRAGSGALLAHRMFDLRERGSAEPVDTYWSRSGADHAARIMNAGTGCVCSSAAIGCRVIARQ